jgi:hypothetical protein
MQLQGQVETREEDDAHETAIEPQMRHLRRKMTRSQVENSNHKEVEGAGEDEGGGEEATTMLGGLL